jgi:hypothetical protein
MGLKDMDDLECWVCPDLEPFLMEIVSAFAKNSDGCIDTLLSAFIWCIFM